MLYLDCFSGVSGDMLLAALLDLGVPLKDLQDFIAAFDLGVSIDTQKMVKQGISCTYLDLKDHRSTKLRLYQDIADLLEKSDIPESIRRSSLSVFDLLAAAEATVHGIPKEKVHFHEIGAIDTIVDITGVFYCLNYLGIQAVFASPLPWASGYLQIAHGLFPLPAPAAALLLKDIPCRGSNAGIELVTPTGAALLKHIVAEFGLFPAGIPQSIGYGAGTLTRSDGIPNLLRAVRYTPDPASRLQHEQIACLETEIDDVNPEIFTYLFNCFESNEEVLDFFLTSVMMKKNRPGVLLTLLVSQPQAEKYAAFLINQTSTLGVRVSILDRITAPRETIQLNTPWGTVNAKLAALPDGKRRGKVEFKDCQEIAGKYGLPIVEVLASVNNILNQYLCR